MKLSLFGFSAIISFKNEFSKQVEASFGISPISFLYVVILIIIDLARTTFNLDMPETNAAT